MKDREIDPIYRDKALKEKVHRSICNSNGSPWSESNAKIQSSHCHQVCFLIKILILSLSLSLSAAKSNRAKTSPRKKSCCQIFIDAIVTFIQVNSLTHIFIGFFLTFVNKFVHFQGIFYCIIFPALVMVGPAGLLYMLYQCYVENDVSRALILSKFE